MSVARLAFLDWMKAIGIALIAWGHLAAGPFTQTTPPVNLKQYGVAFFLFATGFSLARETRPTGRVVFNRLFEVFLYGIGIALVVSAIGFATTGALALSNYLPFVFGANVGFNHFPANPSTWYIGTYIHLIVFWAIVLRGVRITLPLIGLVLLIEIALRALLIEEAGLFVAYQALPNWLTVFLLGLYHGQRAGDERPGLGLWVVVGLFVGGVAWIVLVAAPAPYEFPWNGFRLDNPWAAAAVTSVAVSFVYILYTLLAFGITSRLPTSGVAEFFSRTTLFVFIAHMPVFYGLRPTVDEAVSSWGGRTVIFMSVCFVLLAVIGELLNRLISAKVLRDRLWEWATTRLPARRSTDRTVLPTTIETQQTDR